MNLPRFVADLTIDLFNFLYSGIKEVPTIVCDWSHILMFDCDSSLNNFASSMIGGASSSSSFLYHIFEV